MITVVIRCTNSEDAKGSHSIRGQFVAEILNSKEETDSEIWGKIEVENVALAMDLVARYNWEHQKNNSPISLAEALNYVRRQKEEREKAAAVILKPYSYEWWHEKGRIDRRVLATPHHSWVIPYMDGWDAVEDEDRNAHGEVDYITQ